MATEQVVWELKLVDGGSGTARAIRVEVGKTDKAIAAAIKGQADASRVAASERIAAEKRTGRFVEGAIRAQSSLASAASRERIAEANRVSRAVAAAANMQSREEI